MHAENIFREPGDKLHHPRVLLLAHTGNAAMLIGKSLSKYFIVSQNNCTIFIGGTTIHSAFDFKFGNEITYSSDKKLAELRENLSQLKLIIIDEMSLVGADILYKIDAKLREIFNLRKDIPFAGIGIMLVGDLLQIPPVNSKYIFSRPANDKNIITHDITQHESESYNIRFS